MSGVRVSLVLDTVKASVGSSWVTGPSVVTDETGTFAFENVPVQFTYLRYHGDEILPGSYEPRFEVDEQRIEVTQRCHFRIELLGASVPATRAQLQDADGTFLSVTRIDASGMASYPFTPLQSGQSEVWSVSELATTMIVSDDEGELSRHTIDLVPGEVNVLRL